MAGAVRQPIDEKAFEKFLEENVPIIKTPVDLKQASIAFAIARRTVHVENKKLTGLVYSSASVNPTQRTKSPTPPANAT